MSAARACDLDGRLAPLADGADQPEGWATLTIPHRIANDIAGMRLDVLERDVVELDLCGGCCAVVASALGHALAVASGNADIGIVSDARRPESRQARDSVRVASS